MAMLHEELDARGEYSVEELAGAYADAVAEVVDDLGAEAVAERTGVDPDRIAAVGDRAAVELTVSDAAAVLALADGAPSADAIRASVREQLMLEISGAMLDVDALAAGIGPDLDATEVQAKVEGRMPMTLEEFAAIRIQAARRRGR